MKQGYNDRMDESLGMRDGKESSKKQSYKSRRDESRGSKMSGDFELKDNAHAYPVKGVNSDAEGYDMNRIRKLPMNSKGYSSEAWNYKY